MRTDPYHHSVWLDVLGVVLVGAILLGGAGYLLYHAGGAATGSAVGTAQPGGSVAAPSPSQHAPPQRLRSPAAGASSAPSPLLGRRTESTRGSAAPFSESWRRQATPDLSAPARGGGGSGSPGGGTAASSSPSIASSKSFGSSGRFRDGGGSEAADWRAEARRLANRSRALSRQLGQMDRSRTADAKRNTSSSKTADASTAGAQTSDREVPPPPSVPLGGAEWLAAAGAAYALNRLRKQKEDAVDEDEGPNAA